MNNAEALAVCFQFSGEHSRGWCVEVPPDAWKSGCIWHRLLSLAQVFWLLRIFPSACLMPAEVTAVITVGTNSASLDLHFLDKS